MERARDPIRIWSAGCSTGEEAYTIAMLLAERGLLEDGRVQLLATDLSRRVIESARLGVYGASSFRTTEPAYQQQYFEDAGRGLWRVVESLRAAVQFEQANLIASNTKGQTAAHHLGSNQVGAAAHTGWKPVPRDARH